LGTPLMRILGPIVNQQQNLRGRNRVGQQIQQRLRLLVDPVQILEDHHQRLIHRLAQQNAFDRVQCAPPFDLPIHLRQRVVALDYAQQAEQVGQSVLQPPIEDGNLARDLLPPLTLVVLRYDLEVVLEQIDDRQVGRRSAVGDRAGLQHQAAALRHCFELEEQARLTYS